MVGALALRLASVASLMALAACGDDGPGAIVEPLPDTDTGAPSEVTTPSAICGNAIVEAPELCDEGSDNGTYYHCAADCLGPGPFCGDAVVQPAHETCDDGAVNGDYGRCGYGCNGPAEHCGNGFIEAEHEACDDGELKNGTYGFCAADCQGRAGGCGDGVVATPQESCDDGPDNGKPGFCPSDCNPTPGCGDGTLAAPELCDDGVSNGAYGKCAADCTGPGPMCGDGVVQAKYEACDDATGNGAYGHCRADCGGPGPRCGDGVLQALGSPSGLPPEASEFCDDGAENGQPDRCAIDCLAPTSTWIAGADSASLRMVDAGESCEDSDLLAKYRRYRLRFRGNGSSEYPGFIMIGEGPGYSMPASRREPDTNCSGHWAMEHCWMADIPDARGRYTWGDGTIWLGEYIAMLAQEFAMFKNLGWDTTETASDLQLAMLAFDRVDEKAESFYPGVAPVRDGLFVRDDVPADFYRKPDGSYRFPREDGYAGFECTSGDINCDAPNIRDGSFTSQDQSIQLIFGFAAVATLVPDGVVVKGIDLRQDARAKVHRLVWFVRSHGWKVVDPNGDSPPDAWGGNAIGFSNGFAKSANFICGEDFGVDDYRNFASRTVGEAAWAGIQLIWEATHGYNRTLALCLAAVDGTWDGDKMPRKAMSDGKDYYALMYALMHKDKLSGSWSDWRVESLLRSAPCGGPCNGASGCLAVPGWMGESRVINPEQRVGSRHFEGEMNGMDYMQIFSAYHLYRQGSWLPEPPPAPVANCGGFQGIEQIAKGGAGDGQRYDPKAACAANDRTVELCRRPFASWLEDAYRGKVTIFAGGGRWDCQPGQPCKIVRDGDAGTSGDDLILGSDGDDDLSGGSGNDCVIGYGGNDKLEGNQGYDEIWGGDGNDRIYGEGSGIVLDGEGDVLYGGSGDDYIEGNPGKDELYGGLGNDELDGGNGDDSMMGEDGNDEMRGDAGDDMMRGGPGDDSMIGDRGSDALWAGPGRDKVDGEAGDDHIDGGTGPDFLRGGDGKDTILTGDNWETNQLDHDRACGSSGDDTIWAGWDGDECLGGGWWFGGTDSVNGCDDETATSGDCDNGAFKDW